MKKIILTMTVLVLALLFIVSGCGANKKLGSDLNVTINTSGQENSNRSTKPASANSSADKTTVQDQYDRGEKYQTEGNSKEAITGFLSLSTASDYTCFSDDDLGYNIYLKTVDSLHLNSREMYDDSKISQEDCPALSAALEKYNKKEEEEATKWAENYEQNKDLVLPGEEPHTYTVHQFVQRADGRLLSFLSCNYGYEGAYPVEEVRGYNYDTQTGNTIKLSDVIRDSGELSDILSQKVENANVYDLSAEYKESIDAMLEDDTLEWTLGYDGITCYFNMFDIAPGSAGITPVKISFREYPDLFAEKYTGTMESYAFQVPLYDLFSQADYYTYYDVDGDGTDEYIQINLYESEDSEPCIIQASVDYNSASVENRDIFDIWPTIIHLADGKNYIYVEADDISDLADSLYVFDAQKDIEYIECKEESGAIGYRGVRVNTGEVIITDPDRFEMESFTDPIGNIFVSKTYHVGNDGWPSSDDTEYKILYKKELTSKISLSLQDMNGKTVTFPAGTEFDVLYTDNETYVKLEKESEIYLLPLQDNAGNGINYEDTFDGIDYGS